MGGMRNSNDPWSLAALMWRRKAAILLAGAIGAGLACAAALGLPHRYLATGLLIVDAQAGSAAESSERLTQIDILRSRALLADVASRLDQSDRNGLIPKAQPPLGLANVENAVGRATAELRQLVAGRPAANAQEDPLDPIVDYLGQHLSAGGNENSLALTVGLEAGTPGVAASVVNILMARYIALDGAARNGASARQSEALMQQAQALSRQADADDAQVRSYQSSHDVLSLEAGSTTTLQLTNQQAELAAARLELAQAEALRNADRNPSAASGLTDARQLQSSPVLQALLQRESDIRQQLAGASELGSNNPRRLDLDDELRAVQSQIAVETRRNSVSLDHDVAVARQRVDVLESEVTGAQAQAERSGGAQLELARLEHEAASSRALAQTLFARAEEARSSEDTLSPARVVSPAVPPQRPEPSRLPVMVVLGAIGGALLAASLVLGRHLLRPRIATMRGLQDLTGLPSIACLPRLRSDRLAAPIDLAITEAQSPFAETLRGIRLVVQTIPGPSACKVVLVTSAELGEGKSTLAASLARRAAGDGLRVLLIEADMHRPSLSQSFSLTPGPDLETFLAGREPVRSALATDQRSGLRCLLASGDHQNPFVLLQSDRFATSIARAREDYDLVVIDSPPTLRVSDPILLSRWADVILFAVRADHTAASLVIEALQRFPETCQERLYTVLTHTRMSRDQSDGVYNGYQNATRAPSITSRAPLASVSIDRDPIGRPIAG